MTVVHVKDFSLLYPIIQNSDLLKAIETAIPATAIEQTRIKAIPALIEKLALKGVVFAQ